MPRRIAAVLAGLVLAVPAGLVLAGPAAAQGFELSVRNIMRGPELVGSGPSSVRWTEDGRWVYFEWKPGGLPWHEEAASYRVPARGGAPQRVTDAHMDSVGPLLARGEYSRDRRWKVVSHDGDVWLIDRRASRARRITATEDVERAAVLSPDARTIYFTRGDNLFAVDRSDGAIRQLTDVRKGPAEDDPEAEGIAAYLEAQQRELFEHLRREAAEQERREAEREAREAAGRQPVRIEREERVFGITVAPTERWALLHVGREADDVRQTLVPDYVTESGYTQPLDARTKVGDRQSSARVGLVDVEKGGVVWLDLSPDVEVSAADSVGLPVGDYPDLALAELRGWNRDGSLALVSSVSFDYRHRWLHVVEAATGAVRTIVHDHDPAWIGGPCAFCAGWMPDGSSVWFVSERDGYAHLHAVGVGGGEPRQLTRGPWEVHDVALSPDERRFWLTTNEGSPHEYHFYHMPLTGGDRTRITDAPGIHDVTPSPEGDRLADVHSYSNRPPELYVLQNRRGSPMTRVTDSPTAEWKSFGWVDPEIIRLPARDGVMVPARIYRPRDLGAEPNGAGVIFVHGAGYLQNVHRGWSSYYREYMFHHLLASRGYTVLDIDYRGSEGYGRDWRTAIYRHMGGRDLTDQVDGAAYLAASEGIDPERIGIYGGSYGGFITLMALFTHADRFAAGAALRSVTDWAHYNHWYTARILNQPQDDDTAYRRSSPIYFAAGLEDPLLIAHGMVDTNVHFQDVVRLAQRLIELGKTDWELAVYPVEGHAFVEPASWTDEYRRILDLFERHLAAEPQ
ncbi:MAG TPA: prolyl oligopeptidase family serine peptidase [Longimicrobiales bacterium]|nr:prolyl oligopeptidase family serine peptidase [Longimicrobiales bacterium]